MGFKIDITGSKKKTLKPPDQGCFGGCNTALANVGVSMASHGGQCQAAAAPGKGGKDIGILASHDGVTLWEYRIPNADPATVSEFDKAVTDALKSPHCTTADVP